jgi:hypothetical protein
MGTISKIDQGLKPYLPPLTQFQAWIDFDS